MNWNLIMDRNLESIIMCIWILYVFETIIKILLFNTNDQLGRKIPHKHWFKNI